MRLPSPRRAGFLVTFAACAWAVLILAVPLLAAPSAGALGLRIGASTFLAASLICHQRAERSFHLGGSQLPVCARCTGLYVSGAAGLVFACSVRRRHAPGDWWPSRFSWRQLLVAAALPMAVSVSGEAAGLWEGSNAWRALTAVPAGWAVGAMIIESLSFQGRL